MEKNDKLAVYKLVVCCLLCLLNGGVRAKQINGVAFDLLPQDYQLYPRNEQFEARIPIAGRMAELGWQYVSVQLSRNKQPIGYGRAAVNYTGGVGRFSVLPLTIRAEKAEYDVSVYLVKGTDSVNVVNRTWDVTEGTPGGSNATLTVQWNQATNEATGFDRTKCTVAHYIGGEWHHRVRDYLPATAVVAGIWSRSRENLTSFSPFAVQDYQQVLPVELTRFGATATPRRTVALTWATASERNADRFEVQRASDGRTFGTIGKVAAHGTTAAPHEYAFEDARPLMGRAYYRLRQVDADGQEQFSAVEIVTLTGAPTTATLETYPQPFAADLRLTLTAPTAGPATVEVLDLTGRTVLRQALTLEAGTQVLTLPTNHLPAGAYVVRALLPGGTVLRQRIQKQ